MQVRTILLRPLSWLYGGVTALRNTLFNIGVLRERSFDVPIISVGNLAVGGTGKTPHVEYILRLLHGHNFKAAMLSRGYGRKTRGYVEQAQAGAAAIGDEPCQIQQNCPYARVAVCEKRCVGIERLLNEGERPQVIVLDDAYQHRYVKPGLSILLTDYALPYDKDLLMPAGRLRESSKGAKRADVIVVTKCPENINRKKQEDLLRRLNQNGTKPVFFSRMVYGDLRAYSDASAWLTTETDKDAPVDNMSSLSVLLVCGIAKPQPLYEHLAQQCGQVELVAFPDHHDFTSAELEELGRKAEGFTAVVTTEKDAARLREYNLPEPLLSRLLIQPISLEIQDIEENENQFNKIITDYVTSYQTNR